jgi:ssRNA-specific RNase YbeY (16S rRNA maturation enzyme)
MINFNYESEFNLERRRYKLAFCGNFVGRQERGEINYIFCDDEYLHKINLEYLNTMT